MYLRIVWNSDTSRLHDVLLKILNWDSSNVFRDENNLNIEFRNNFLKVYKTRVESEYLIAMWSDTNGNVEHTYSKIIESNEWGRECIVKEVIEKYKFKMCSWDDLRKEITP